MVKKSYTKRQAAVKNGYRSGLEEDLDSKLKAKGISGEYEQHKINYIQPQTKHMRMLLLAKIVITGSVDQPLWNPNF